MLIVASSTVTPFLHKTIKNPAPLQNEKMAQRKVSALIPIRMKSTNGVKN